MYGYYVGRSYVLITSYELIPHSRAGIREVVLFTVGGFHCRAFNVDSLV